MKNIKKIIVVADFLRFGQFSNEPIHTIKQTRWLYKLLSYPISSSTSDFPIEALWHGNGINSYEFYKSLSTEANFKGWTNIFASQANINFDLLVANTFKSSLVIGFELPDILISSLTRNCIPYIDTLSSPIRFSDDMIFCWRSNIQQVQNCISRFQLNPNIHNYYANLISSKFIWAETTSFPKNTALLMGQVADDRSLIDRDSGKVVCFRDYLGQIHNVLNKYNNVIYKPHPYGTTDPFIIDLLSNNKVSIIDDNYYKILCSKNIDHVYAISSGSIDEAQYFNIKATAFKKPLYKIATLETSTILNTPVEVSNEWLKPFFWAEILSPILKTYISKVDKSVYNSRNTLRRSMNADWNFSQIDSLKL